MPNVSKATKTKQKTVAERIADRLFEDATPGNKVDRLILAYDLATEAPHHYGEVLDGTNRVWLRGGWSIEAVIRIINEELKSKGA